MLHSIMGAPREGWEKVGVGGDADHDDTQEAYVMQVVYRPIDSIQPYKNNPRHNDGAVDKVRRSIEAYGFRVPILIDAGGTVIAGHTRLKAAEQLGLKKVPCIVADDMTDEQAKAYRLVDNKTAEFASWDEVKLADELIGISVDMEQFGFAAEGYSYLDDLMEDEFAALPAESEYYGVTFVFRRADKAMIDQYIKDNGKDGLVDLMLRHMRGDDHA